MDQSLANNDLENIYETLNTVGWDLLSDGFHEQYEACNRVEGCSTLDELHYRRGMMVVLKQLMNLRDDIKEELKHAHL